MIKNTRYECEKATSQEVFNLKNMIKRTLCFTLVLAIGLMPIWSDHNGSAAATESGGALFRNVTGEVDLSSIAEQNLDSSVLRGNDSAESSASYGEHTVIVSLTGDTLVDGADGADVSEYASSQEGRNRANSIRKSQDKFLNKLSGNGISYRLENRYVAVDNAVAITIDTKYVSAIKEMAGVQSVCLSETYAYPQSVDMGTYASASEEELTDALSATVNQTSVYQTGVYDSSSVIEQYGYDGDGSVVAIVDTGLDYTHKAFTWDDERTLEKYPLKNAVLNSDKIASILAEKDLMAEQRSALNGQSIDMNDVYISQKVPFAYDYADNDTDVYPSYSNHGTHVAGIVAGYDPSGYTDKNGNHVSDPFIGVAPNAQLVICKVFSDDIDDSEVGGADTEDILAALEDCIFLGVDVINMSLGTTCGFSATDDGDEEGELLNKVYNAVRDAGISLVCAASNDYSSSYGGNFGTNLASNPDSGTVGSPGSFAAALAVASISGQTSPYMIANGETPVYYEDSNDQYNKSYSFSDMLLQAENSKEFEYVVVPNVGRASDYASVGEKLEGKIALVKRGNNTFKEKVELAKEYGAIGIIVYNNVSGMIRMSLGEVEDPIPSAAISMDAGKALVDYAAKHNRVGKILISRSLKAGPFMSDFSSWGCTPDLKLKPEITAHGGEITSAVPGGYGEQSGTSMASPNMAGVVSIIRSYLKKTQPTLNTRELTQRINQLIMSTATIVYDRDGWAYSPRKQGAGLGSLANAISSGAYLYTDDDSVDYRPLVNLGDDKEKNGVYEITFKIKNFGTSEFKFEVKPTFMTETLSSDGLAVAEQAYMLDDEPFSWSVSGKGTKNGNFLTIAAGDEAEIRVTLTLSNKEKNYIDTSFKNGMFVEGFIGLVSQTDGQCDLTLPFMGFYGDWTAAPMLDYSAYEVDASLKDTSVADEDKLNASIWETQPYTMYYNEEYSMPMGSFSYLQDENADRVYTVEEHNAVSCYNEYFGDSNPENYLTAYQFRGLYVGLLRGARTVKYSLKNAETGEILYEKTEKRINKAYTGGGSGSVPSFIKFELPPLEYGFVSNGKYTMDFEFFMDYGDPDRSEPDGTYSFSFYADYEAPVLEDVRVRFADYTENDQVKQRIYLDLDVFDNHYAQAALLCYYDGEFLQQVTEYVTPVYNSVRNGKSTVSIEITDIYEKYKDRLYLQLDDYALNHSVYYIDLTAAKEGVTPDTFELNEGESEVTLDRYEAHKVSLAYSGSANLSNFTWSSQNRSIADVKNGEIVGINAGKTVVTVSNGKGVYKTINVTVTEKTVNLAVPSLSFSVIEDSEDKLVSADNVSLYPDQDVTLTVETDPWYYPKDTLTLKWTSTDSEIVSVDQNGKLTLKKKGKASVKAILIDSNGQETAYSAVVRINVLDPFVISGYSLTHYRGTDKVVTIPDDKMILYIGEEAFKDNGTMEEVIIPKTVININERAFQNCSALKRVYLVSREAQAIPDADLKLVYRDAFSGCTALESVDLTNVKTITLGVNAFANCSSLKEVKNMAAVGTAFSYAFYKCSSLKSVDLTGMHVAGIGVFESCTSISEVLTGYYTAIGNEMFKNCTALAFIQLNNTAVGNNAFEGCTRLSKVELNQKKAEYEIGAEAFLNSGLSNILFADGCLVREIGDRAFANTKIASITLPNGLREIGSGVFSGTTKLKKIVLPASFSLEQIRLAGALFAGKTIELADDSDYRLENGVLYDKDYKILLSVFGSSSVTTVSIPETVEKIYDYAFAGSGITSITVPASVKEIGKGAFKDSKLSSIAFEGDRLSEIAEETFYGTKLVSITLPNSVAKIGSYAFANSFLNAISVGDNVSSIGSYAFAYCNKLRSVALSDSVKTIDDYAFSECSALTEITIPSVREAGEGVFVRSGLKSVTFGDDAESLGEYTFFGLKDLNYVRLSEKMKTIGENMFYGCESLEEVVIGGVQEIQAYAFAGCEKLSTIDLSEVVIVGELAFYNCNALKRLNLAKAEEIETGAFAVDNGMGGATEISMPVVKEIGNSAFEGVSVTSVNLPASLEKIGFGAFAYAKSLGTVTVSEENEIFFVKDDVLYKNVLTGGYELLLYPAAKTHDGDTYTVLEGTIRIDAYAFAGLVSAEESVSETEKSTLSKVILPYSVIAIGDSAFFESGITEYTFEGINAPALETVYKYEVEEILTENFANMTDPVINSYYYSNFNTLFVYYVDMVGEKSELVMNYPENGNGYDNFVYSRYFGVKNKTDVVMDETTRSFLETMNEVVSDETLSAWETKANGGDTATYYADVQAFSELLKTARRLYENIKDEAQLRYVDETLVERLGVVENRMRSIKSLYGIKVRISRLKYEKDSYKSVYNEGEFFDMTGLKVIVVYDDGSTDSADASKLTLITTAELKSYYRDVEVRYTVDGTEYTVYVAITVNAADDVTDNPEKPEKEGCGSAIDFGSALLFVGLLGTCVAAIIKKKEF